VATQHPENAGCVADFVSDILCVYPVCTLSSGIPNLFVCYTNTECLCCGYRIHILERVSCICGWVDRHLPFRIPVSAMPLILKPDIRKQSWYKYNFTWINVIMPASVIFCIVRYVHLSVLVDHGFKKHIASPCAYVCELPSEQIKSIYGTLFIF
jgi:hypothetical protein